LRPLTPFVYPDSPRLPVFGQLLMHAGVPGCRQAAQRCIWWMRRCRKDAAPGGGGSRTSRSSRARGTSLDLCREASSVLIQPVPLPVDGGGVPA
jgi:hypothetical protein